MELTFKQNEELNYEAEIKVDGDFNLHIERVSKGPIYLMLRGTSEGEYSNSAVLDNDDDTLDYDFAALVYPKWIKIVSGSEVVSASVNFNEGGGSGSGSGEGNIAGEYYALKPVEGLDPYDYSLYVTFLGLLSEVKFGDYNIINPTARILSNYWSSHQFSGPYDVLMRTTAFCFRPIKRLFEYGDGTVYTFNTLQDALNNEEFDEETINLILASIEPITEEEFYNIEA